MLQRAVMTSKRTSSSEAAIFDEYAASAAVSDMNTFDHNTIKLVPYPPAS
jgi:hypothetical protein